MSAVDHGSIATPFPGAALEAAAGRQLSAYTRPDIANSQGTRGQHKCAKQHRVDPQQMATIVARRSWIMHGLLVAIGKLTALYLNMRIV
jgi:hypothetical protein